MFHKFLNKILNSDITKKDVEIKSLYGKNILLNNRKKYSNLNSINDAEEKIFSQNGEDGIIDYLLEKIGINEPRFVEIGVEDYIESNTRLIYEIRNSEGLIIDQKINLKKLSTNLELWKGRLKTLEVSINSNNINDILKKMTFDKNLDIFSIDVDGTDYWILDQMPEKFSKICVAEYNPLFGHNYKITVPNLDNFDRTNYHYSNLCWGLSIKALIDLMENKKFIFLGTNKFKNNAFFVSNEHTDIFRDIIPIKDDLNKYVDHKFKESRNKKKELTFLNIDQQLHEIKDCEIIHLQNSKKIKTTIGKLFKI